jgi:hypothetical protein
MASLLLQPSIETTLPNTTIPAHNPAKGEWPCMAVNLVQVGFSKLVNAVV